VSVSFLVSASEADLAFSLHHLRDVPLRFTITDDLWGEADDKANTERMFADMRGE
jgi:hypothetical protein